MAIRDFFKKGDRGVPEHFWSLVITSSWVEAGIWRVVGERAEVVAQGGASSWQKDGVEALVSAVDSTLSAAASAVEEDVPEPNKVVFGLPPSWVEEGSIKKEYLDILQKLSKELELSPTGFVVIPEAIAHFLKVREGTPANTILVGLTEDSIDVSLVQNGKILGTEEVARSMSLGADVAEGLARLEKLAQYPSRILLYDHRSVNLDEAKQNLIDTDWNGLKISFLHTPKVDSLPEDVGVISVSLAGGAEVGHATAIASPEEEVGEEELEEEKQEEAPAETQEEPVTAVEEEEALEEVPPEQVGFVTGADIIQQRPVAKEPPASQGIPGREESAAPLQKAGMFQSVLSFFGNLHIPSLSFGGRGLGLLGIVGGVLVLLLIIGGVAYWRLPKANITIFVAPKQLEKNITVTVDPELSVVNQEDKVIPGRFIETEVSGEKTTNTTGSRTVGDRAKGSVTISHVGGSTKLSEGTAITGPGGLEFTLDEEILVASGSSILNPSTAEASVTAVDIGAQYNLASGTEFSVGNFSKADFVASNSEAFSGGSSREVAAASKEDLEKLEKELTEELLAKGFDSAQDKADENDFLINDSAIFDIVDQDFSAKTGEEASTLKLSMSGTVQILAAREDDLNSLLMSQLENDVPEGFLLRQDQLEVEFAQGEEETEFKVKIKANLLPQIDPDEVAKSVAGKYPDVAKDYLTTIPGFTRVQISTGFKLPGRLGTLPRVAQNITVEVAAER